MNERQLKGKERHLVQGSECSTAARSTTLQDYITVCAPLPQKQLN